VWISSSAIAKPVVTVVVMLALVVFGLISLGTLATDEFPEVDPPVIAVSIPYPGASPESVERELLDPLEDRFMAISGVDEIQSTAYDGFAILVVIFLFDKNLQEASQDIRDAISELRRDLPPEIEEPVLTRFDPQDLPIVSLTLSSPSRPVAELTRLADPSITGALRRVSGVAEARLVGGVERELRVQIIPEAMQAAGVTVGQIAQALQSQNLAAPVGRVTEGAQERTIRLLGRLERVDQFQQLVVGVSGGRIVRLGEVAEVVDGTEEPRSLALYNGTQAVGIDIVKATNESTTAVSRRIGERLAEVRRELPQDVELTVVRDSGVRVAESVHDVESSLLEGALLTVMVVFLFLASWRSTVITGLALPVSVLASFIAVKAFGFTLNTVSLLGLSLAIGILIDDAIVVRENIVRHMEMGKGHLAAAREGTSEIGLAVTATTLSIVVVFVPVAFMGGLAQQWLAPMALTIAASVLVSLLVSFSLDPMLSAHWADPEVEDGHKTRLTRPLMRFNGWLDHQTSRYQRLVGWALRHRIAMALIAGLSFALALALPAVGLVGSELFPQQDVSELLLDLETPPGSTLEETRLKATAASELARALPEVAYTYTTVGGEGEVVDVAQMYVRLKPRSQRSRSQAEIALDLRHRLQRIAGVTTSLPTGGFGSQKQIQVQLTGPDLSVLTRLAGQLASQVGSVPGAADVALSTRGQKPELEVVLDRALASSLGVSVAQVAQTLRPAFAGIDVGDWIDPSGETRDVTLVLAPEKRRLVSDIESLPIAVAATAEPPTAASGPTGATIPLGQIAEVHEALGPTQITHLDNRRVIVVGANTEGRPLSAVLAGVRAKLAGTRLPPGYALSQGGDVEAQEEIFGRLLLALVAAILLMYLILVVQFGSFLDPLPIMASLPLSLIGVMLALLVTGSTLNMMSMIGVVLLMGIVAKNAILLIDFAKWGQARGMSRQEAIVEAGGVRLRPILMTSLAIIAGMIPIAIGMGEGGDFRAPLGRAVIGGVITSTLLTLLVIPTAYDILSGWRERLLGKMRRHRIR
jgi:hydrophobe/amphiphile efflux-1 (HAE1) family protein